METFAEGLATRVAFELPQRILRRAPRRLRARLRRRDPLGDRDHDRDDAQPGRGGGGRPAGRRAEPARAARGQAGRARLQRRQHQPARSSPTSSRGRVAPGRRWRMSARADGAPRRGRSASSVASSAASTSSSASARCSPTSTSRSAWRSGRRRCWAAARSSSTASSAGRASRRSSWSSGALLGLVATAWTLDRPRARDRARRAHVQQRAARPGGAVKITGVRTFVVGNPTPGYGGRYFIFLKLESDGGLEGLGEVYVATVSPQLVAAHGRGRRRAPRGRARAVPHRGDLARRLRLGLCDAPGSHARGRALGHRDGDVGPRRQGGRQAGLRAARRARARAAARLQLPLRGAAATPRDVYADPGLAAAARRRIRRAGLHGDQVRPRRAVRVLRSAAAVARRSRPLRALRRADPRGGRIALRPAVRHARPVHRLRRDPPGAAARALRSALVRGADAARVARGDGARRARDVASRSRPASG